VSSTSKSLEFENVGPRNDSNDSALEQTTAKKTAKICENFIVTMTAILFLFSSI
jgi:hypothetical protein